MHITITYYIDIVYYVQTEQLSFETRLSPESPAQRPGAAALAREQSIVHGGLGGRGRGERWSPNEADLPGPQPSVSLLLAGRVVVPKGWDTGH